MQVFPGKLLESTYPDPRNPDQILGRSEVERRREWIDQLEKELREGEQHPLTQMVKQCLQNEPARRPTTEQLLASLKGMREAIEGPYGNFSKLDAVRQVTMTRELVGRDIQMRRVTSELALRTGEVQQLRQQLEVGTQILYRGVLCTFTVDQVDLYYCSVLGNASTSLIPGLFVCNVEKHGKAWGQGYKFCTWALILEWVLPIQNLISRGSM